MKTYRDNGDLGLGGAIGRRDREAKRTCRACPFAPKTELYPVLGAAVREIDQNERTLFLFEHQSYIPRTVTDEAVGYFVDGNSSGSGRNWGGARS